MLEQSDHSTHAEPKYRLCRQLGMERRQAVHNKIQQLLIF